MDLEPNPYAPPRASLREETGPVPWRKYPWWVKASLWGVPGRAGLWAFVVICLALAAGSAIYGFWDRRFLFGIGFLFSALMYWLSIRWIDRHGSWTPEA